MTSKQSARSFVLPRQLSSPHTVPYHPAIESALRGASLVALQGSLVRKDLWFEASLFARLLYKSKSQHHGSKHFKYLSEVKRHIKLLQQLQLSELLGDLNHLSATSSVGMPSSASVVMFSSANKLQVPSQQAGILVLQRLLAGCRLAAQAVPAAHAAAAQLLAQLSMTYFMPFCLTALAMVARIQVLVCQLLLDAIKAYNSLLPLVTVLPRQQSSKATDVWPDLPQMLSCSWQAGVPTLNPLPHTDHASFQAAAQAFAAEQSALRMPAGKGHSTIDADDMGEKISRAAMMPGQPIGCVRQAGTVDGNQPGSGFNPSSEHSNPLASDAAVKAGKAFRSKNAAATVTPAQAQQPKVQASKGEANTAADLSAAVRQAQGVSSAAQQRQLTAATNASTSIQGTLPRLHADQQKVHQQRHQQQQQQQEEAATAEDSALLVFEDRGDPEGMPAGEPAVHYRRTFPAVAFTSQAGAAATAEAQGKSMAPKPGNARLPDHQASQHGLSKKRSQDESPTGFEHPHAMYHRTTKPLPSKDQGSEGLSGSRQPQFKPQAPTATAIHPSLRVTHQKQQSHLATAQPSSQLKEGAAQNLLSRHKAAQKSLSRPAFIRIGDGSSAGTAKAVQGKAQTALSSAAKSAAPAGAQAIQFASQINNPPNIATAAPASADATHPASQTSHAPATAAAAHLAAKTDFVPHAAAPAPAADSSLTSAAAQLSAAESAAPASAHVSHPASQSSNPRVSAAAAPLAAMTDVRPHDTAARTAAADSSTTSAAASACGPDANAGKAHAQSKSAAADADSPIVSALAAAADGSAPVTELQGRIGPDNSAASTLSAPVRRDEAAGGAQPLLLQTSKRRKKANKAAKPQGRATTGGSSWQDLLSQSHSTVEDSARAEQQLLDQSHSTDKGSAQGGQQLATGVSSAAEQARSMQSPAAEPTNAAQAQTSQDIMQMLLGIK